MRKKGQSAEWLLHELSLLILLFIHSFTESLPIHDHCSNSVAILGDTKPERGKKQYLNNTLLIPLSLHDTTCVEVTHLNDISDSRSTLHVLTFERLDQIHPIGAMYKFGLPRVRISCFCDCEGGEKHCSYEKYNLQNCSSGPVCVRTFHSSQSSLGCFIGGRSDACCEIRIEPHENRKYTAVQVGQADTLVILKHKIYEKFSGEYTEPSIETKVIQLNRGSSKSEISGRMEISITGNSPNRQLMPGMYFIYEGSTQLRGGVAVNEEAESNLHKLGWLRYIQNDWVIANAKATFKEKQILHVRDCQQQQYETSLNAYQYIQEHEGKDHLHYNLGHEMTEDPWIGSATLEDRSVRVQHIEGTHIQIYLTTSSRPSVLRQASHLGSFEGDIRVDGSSHRQLNVTFKNSKGVLLGNVYSSAAKERIDFSYSVSIGSQLSSYRSTASIDSSINSDRYVCFHPMGEAKAEQCKLFRFYSTPLATAAPSSVLLLQQTGNCPNCNLVGVQSYLEYLDPRTWFTGGDNLKKLCVMIGELTLGISVLVFAMCTITKCVIPLARCSFYVPKVCKTCV